MLLVEPPLSSDQWARWVPAHAQLAHAFADYCAKYRQAVLSLPLRKLLDIWGELSRGLQCCDVGPEFVHVVAERELKERDFEATRKVAKLIVLGAVAELLRSRGVRVPDKTQAILDTCQARIPQLLALAVTVHFGQLRGPGRE